MSDTAKIHGTSLGQALGFTNFVMALLLLVAVNLTGVDMHGVTWKFMLIVPFIAWVAGILYGMIGAILYNWISVKMKSDRATSSS